MKKRSHFLVPLAIFLFVLGCVALTINAKTQVDFNLQQMGVESLVERHTFALEGSKSRELQPLGDTFSYEEHTYAIKQPGQFVIGAIIYSILHTFGYSYVSTYVSTAALVTLFSSGVACAAIALSLYYSVQHMHHSIIWSALVALVVTVGTILLPYAGVAHHDTIATACVFLGWSLVFLSKDRPGCAWKYLVAGFLVGISLFISMLPILLCACIGIYVLLSRSAKMVCYFSLGGALGAVPVFLYNQLLFGNTFAFPNSISGTTDTTPFFSLVNMGEKLRFYLFSPASSIFVFMPVLLCALVGLFLFEKKWRRETLCILLMCVFHLLYVCSIETVGHAQYGPRYLLPILPFLGLGLAGLYRSPKVIKAFMLLCSIISLIIAWFGALGGVMYQTIWIHPFPKYVQMYVQGEFSRNPLSLLGCIFLIVSFLLAYCTFSMRDRNV